MLQRSPQVNIAKVKNPPRGDSLIIGTRSVGGGGADVRAVRLRLRARSVSSCLECVWQNLCYQFRPEMQARSRRDTFSDGRIPPPPGSG